MKIYKNNREIYQLIQSNKAKLDNILDILDPDERDVIRARYVEKAGWELIPDKIYMSRAKCFRVHNRAILKILDAFSNK